MTRKRTASKDYKNEAFELLLARFDRVDQDNKEIKDSMSQHIKDDLVVHDQVNRHGTYWGLLIGLGTPTVLGLLAWAKGLFR